MASASTVFRGTREDLLAILQQLPGILAGRVPDPWGIVQGLQLRLGNVLLSKIQQAFLVKARGGTDECGITWPPLKKATIANRRPAPRKKRGERPMGLLTDAEDKRWRKLFGKWVSILLFRGMGIDAAKERAGQIAWTILKADGAQTKLDVYGNRTVETLRDTNILFGSFAVGVDDRPSGAPGQVFRTGQGYITVGTNQKPWHHKGVPGKLPARLFWPPDGKLPDSWWNALNGALRRGLLLALVDILSRRAA